MNKTLADMTPAEREQCRGTWCDVQMMGGGTAQFIFSKLRPGPRMGAYLTEPGEHMPWTAEYEAITPRFDLTRAWNPDGTPVDGAWESSTALLPTNDYKEKYIQHYRRWVGEWENMP